LQYPIAWEDKARNVALTIRRIRRLKNKADVALLPEMFSTGFCTDQPELAETMDGPTLQALKQVANETDVAVCGSLIITDKGKLYNRGFFIRPNGETTYVDKAHLYAHGGEDKFFSQGRERTIIEYKGIKMRLLLCYDLRFPAWARNQSGNDYDILLVSANWPEIRIHYWDALIAARATENQCYIAAVNPVGDDGLQLHYNGHSVAYDTHLNKLVSFKNNQAGTRIATFDMNQLWHFRQVLPLWKDTDHFEINA